MNNDTVHFQILIDQAGYKQYSIGNINGYHYIKINNIRLQNNGNHQYVIRMKSNILQFESGSPTNDILFMHRNGASEIDNPICLYAQLQTWIDFTITDYDTNAAPANFQYILLHCEATPVKT